MKGTKPFSLHVRIFFPVFLRLFFFVSVYLFPIYAVQKHENKVDWKRFVQSENLQEKYSFLAQEYKKLTDYWERALSIESGNQNPDFEVSELFPVLDKEIPEIRPFLFQQWAADNFQPEAADILPETKIEEKLKEWNNNSFSTSQTNEFLAVVHKLMASYLAWKVYNNLAIDFEQANLIFYEGFESGDLSQWQKTGGEDNISVDSERKAKGSHALKLLTNENVNPVILIRDQIQFYPSKIHIEWYAWLPSIDRECAECSFCLKILGNICFYKSNLGQNQFMCRTNNLWKTFELEPNRWCRFEVFCDYDMWLYDVFIDGKEIWKKMPFEDKKKVINALNKINVSYMGFFNQPAWVDEIKISYLK